MCIQIHILSYCDLYSLFGSHNCIFVLTLKCAKPTQELLSYFCLLGVPVQFTVIGVYIPLPKMYPNSRFGVEMIGEILPTSLENMCHDCCIDTVDTAGKVCHAANSLKTIFNSSAVMMLSVLQ